MKQRFTHAFPDPLLLYAPQSPPKPGLEQPLQQPQPQPQPLSFMFRQLPATTSVFREPCKPEDEIQPMKWYPITPGLAAFCLLDEATLNLTSAPVLIDMGNQTAHWVTAKLHLARADPLEACVARDMEDRRKPCEARVRASRKATIELVGSDGRDRGIRLEIVKQPSHGTLELIDGLATGTGEVVQKTSYTPKGGYYNAIGTPGNFTGLGGHPFPANLSAGMGYTDEIAFTVSTANETSEVAIMQVFVIQDPDKLSESSPRPSAALSPTHDEFPTCSKDLPRSRGEAPTSTLAPASTVRIAHVWAAVGAGVACLVLLPGLLYWRRRGGDEADDTGATMEQMRRYEATLQHSTTEL